MQNTTVHFERHCAYRRRRKRTLLAPLRLDATSFASLILNAGPTAARNVLSSKVPRQRTAFHLDTRMEMCATSAESRRRAIDVGPDRMRRHIHHRDRGKA